MMIFRPLIKSKYILAVLSLLLLFNLNTKGSNIDSLLTLLPTLKNDTTKVNLLIDISENYNDASFVNTIKYAKQSLKLSEILGYQEGKLNSLIILANSYDFIGNYSEAQKLNFHILSIYEQDKNVEGINSTYNNIGIIHYYLGNYNQAIEFTEKALQYYVAKEDLNGISMCYNNIANSYSDELDYEKALTYYFKALDIYETAKDKSGVSLIKGNVGEVYIEQEKYDEAFPMLISALHIAEELDDKWQQANVFTSIGDLLYRQNKSDEAINFLLQALKINKALGVKAEIGEIYATISKVYEQKQDDKKALHYLKLETGINNELFSERNSKNIAEMNALYEINEKEKEILKQEVATEVHKSQKKVLIIGSLIGFLLLFIIVGISLKGNLSKRKTNKILELQKQQIETKNRDITDSILYAKKIQAAILPAMDNIKDLLPDSFIFYKPKDIVAGDFYWIDVKGDNVLFAVADCTGHGVPGAMVSVVCNNALNRAVREFQLSSPAQILDKVTELVIETFEQSDANIKDGMDIALCSLNTKTNELQYAGANNSLYIIRNNELIETKADKQPIGKFTHQKPFTNHIQKTLKGDNLYLFTDGYADQFGGEKGKKFKYKQFKQLLIDNNKKTLSEQLNILGQSFQNWKGDLEQIDDVCIIGVRI